MKPESASPRELMKRAFAEQNAALFRDVLARHPELKPRINEPIAAFDSPLITGVRSRELLDALLEAGADINAKSRWWAGGFGLLHNASPDLAAYAIERGASVDVHAAARLGLFERLQALISADPASVHARGGDGQTPLHFAATVAVARYLLEQGADVDARDVDHESTPAQHMIRDRQEVVRFLIGRGCRTDILMAAALGDAELANRHLDSNPDCIRLRVNEQYFPMTDKRAGGTIYQWTLGFHVSPHEVAKQFGHDEVFALLMRRSPPDVKLIAACWLDDEANVRALLTEHPGLAADLINSYSRQVADAARNNNLAAVRLMLAAGLPADVPGQHGGTPLHWAAFHGNAQMASLLLRSNPPLELLDRDFHATPLGWAIHGSEHGWSHQTGDYAATAETLLRAGARPPAKLGGTDAVRVVLGSHGVPD
ncbi:MAG TPA: ankyrin repeat domain-containing protein [Candidatus Acidoferrum sp.]|jgi:ankyrin repeat protein|nr:ankyrin repeat domain-containing protein [Candidatus Acidoferrum sp.]